MILLIFACPYYGGDFFLTIYHMSKIKALFLAAAVCCAIGASAADYYLHLKTASGWKVLNLDEVSTLSFKGNNMVAKSADDKVVLDVPKAELELMSVDQSAGIEATVVASNEGDATFTFDANARKAVMKSTGSFEMYGTGGEALLSIPSVSASDEIDLSNITPGVVILKSGNYSLKALLK